MRIKTVKQHREDLAKAIRERREELGLSRMDIPKRGGPSIGTVQTWEQGKSSSVPLDATLMSYDGALEWPMGTCKSILGLQDTIDLSDEPAPADDVILRLESEGDNDDFRDDGADQANAQFIKVLTDDKMPWLDLCLRNGQTYSGMVGPGGVENGVVKLQPADVYVRIADISAIK